jgi:hypothetical protein
MSSLRPMIDGPLDDERWPEPDEDMLRIAFALRAADVTPGDVVHGYSYAGGAWRYDGEVYWDGETPLHDLRRYMTQTAHWQ